MALTEADILATFPMEYRGPAEQLNAEHERLRARVFGGRRIHTHYVLDAQHVAIAVGLGTWAVWLELENRKPDAGQRRVASDRWHDARVGEVHVSTVFLGLDHSFQSAIDDSPVPREIFETMIFFHDPDDSDRDQGQWRYATWGQAEAGHALVVSRARAYLAGALSRAEFDET